MNTPLRFGLIGAANTLVDVVGFTGLCLLGLPAVAANLVSTSVGMALSFTLNRRFTFRAGSDTPVRQVVSFLLVTVTGLWVLHPVVIAAVSAALPVGLPAVLAVALPKLAAVGVGLVWNFALYDRVVFPAAARTVS